MAFHLPATEVKHYLMINLLVDQLRKEGYSDIRARHLVSAPAPSEIEREDGPPLTPDVVAGKNGRELIVEVKTEEALLEPETEEEIRAFSRYAEETGSEFCLMVPEKGTARLKYLLEGMGKPEVPVFYI